MLCALRPACRFKNPGESDSDALQQAADACAGSCTLILNRVYYLDKVGIIGDCWVKEKTF